MRRSGRDSQIDIRADRDIATASIRLDVQIVHVQHGLAAIAEGHVRQRQVRDHTRLQDRLDETGKSTGTTNRRPAAIANGPRETTRATNLQTAGNVCLATQLIPGDEKTVGDRGRSARGDRCRVEGDERLA